MKLFPGILNNLLVLKQFMGVSRDCPFIFWGFLVLCLKLAGF